MRKCLTILGAVAAVALYSAPAHASGCLSDPNGECPSQLVPIYWENPLQKWCPYLNPGCDLF